MDVDVLLGLALLAAAAVMLTAGAELFVEHLAGAARRLGLTTLAVAVLLAGAEPEEAVTGMLASHGGYAGLAVGDAIGANITMLTAALGVAALVRPLPVGERVRRYALAAIVAGLLAVAVLAGGVVSRWEGAALFGGYLAFVALVWRRERRPPAIGELAELDDDDDDDMDDDAQSEDEPDDEQGHDLDDEPYDEQEHDSHDKHDDLDDDLDDDPDDEGPGTARGTLRPTHDLMLALVGLAVMTAGGAFAVNGAVRVASAAGLSEAAVGLTALALATTAELFALAWAAMRRDVPEVAVAAVVAAVLPALPVMLSSTTPGRPAGPRVIGRRVAGLLVVLYAGYVLLLL